MTDAFHVSAEMLAAYVSGELSASDDHHVETHVFGCARCQRRLTHHAQFEMRLHVVADRRARARRWSGYRAAWNRGWQSLAYPAGGWSSVATSLALVVWVSGGDMSSPRPVDAGHATGLAGSSSDRDLVYDGAAMVCETEDPQICEDAMQSSVDESNVSHEEWSTGSLGLPGECPASDEAFAWIHGGDANQCRVWPSGQGELE